MRLQPRAGHLHDPSKFGEEGEMVIHGTYAGGGRRGRLPSPQAASQRREGVSQWVWRVTDRHGEEPAFTRHLDELDRMVAGGSER